MPCHKAGQMQWYPTSQRSTQPFLLPLNQNPSFAYSHSLTLFFSPCNSCSHLLSLLLYHLLPNLQTLNTRTYTHTHAHTQCHPPHTLIKIWYTSGTSPPEYLRVYLLSIQYDTSALYSALSAVAFRLPGAKVLQDLRIWNFLLLTIHLRNTIKICVICEKRSRCIHREKKKMRIVMNNW